MRRETEDVDKSETENLILLILCCLLYAAFGWGDSLARWNVKIHASCEIMSCRFSDSWKHFGRACNNGIQVDRSEYVPAELPPRIGCQVSVRLKSCSSWKGLMGEVRSSRANRLRIPTVIDTVSAVDTFLRVLGKSSLRC